jgi:hypothetical protein
MDLTPLRPSVRFLSGKARKQECISRSRARLSTWVAACKVVLADQDPGRVTAPRRLLTYVFSLLSCRLHRLFAVLLPAKLAENPDKPTSCHLAEHNWSGQPSAILPRSSRELSSIRMFVDFALWPAFCSPSWQSKSTPWIWREPGIAFVRGTYG